MFLGVSESVRGVEMNEDEREQFAARLREEVRTRFGGSAKAAYTAAGVNSTTWKRAVEGLTLKATSVTRIVSNLWPEAAGDWTAIPETGSTVSAPRHSWDRYVASQGGRVDAGRTDDEVLRALTAVSATLDQLLAGQRDLSERAQADRDDAERRFSALEASQRELSERLAKLEEPRP